MRVYEVWLAGSKALTTAFIKAESSFDARRIYIARFASPNDLGVADCAARWRDDLALSAV